MSQGKKHKAKSGKPREAARREEPETARAGEGAEPSPSQEPGQDSGDEDTTRPKLSKPFTNQQDKQITEFFGQHPCFYDMSHPDYKNKKKRTVLIQQFAQSMFTSGKCVLSFNFNFWAAHQEALTSPITWIHRALNRLLGNVQPLLRRPGLPSNSTMQVINIRIVSVTTSLKEHEHDHERDYFESNRWHFFESIRFIC